MLSRGVLGVCVGGMWLLAGCHRDEEGPRRLAHAEARYAELVEQGAAPTDKAFDAVIAELESVPQDSKARPEAERRLAALKTLRGPLPPRPLRRPDTEDAGTHEHAHEDEAGRDGGG